MLTVNSGQTLAAAAMITPVIAASTDPALWFGYAPSAILFATIGAGLSLARSGEKRGRDKTEDKADSPTVAGMVSAFLLGLSLGVTAPPVFADSAYAVNLASFALGYFGAEIVRKTGDVLDTLDLKDKLDRWLDRRLGIDRDKEH